MQAHSGEFRRQGRTIALVPTMGFLHEGHLSLMRIARQHADVVVVSIFVNPTQFAPSEDFDAYPRALDRDVHLTRQVGVDVVFSPDREGLYAPGFQTWVALDALPRHLCGISRPDFFRGVTTVVAKLFHIVQPHVAVFGEKDFQQLTIVRRMALDLNMDIRILGGPTVREPDGLAMSSRNAYLRPHQREAALSLFRALNLARGMVESGETDPLRIIARATELIRSHPETDIDYISVVDPETLEGIRTLAGPARMALAVKVGGTRLIDNMALSP